MRRLYPLFAVFLLSIFVLFNSNPVEAQPCVLQTNWTFNPPVPPSGSYDAGTTIEICGTITNYLTSGANWIHGIEFNFPPAYDVSSIVVVSAPQQCSGNNGIWMWMPNTFLCQGLNVGPGFFYDVNSGGPQDGNPCNNYGDPCFGTNANWSWCLQVTLSGACGGPGNPLDGSSIVPEIQVWGDGDTGSWGPTTGPCNGIGISSSPNVTMNVNCCDAESGVSPGTVPICGSAPISLLNQLLPPVQNVNGTWSGPNGVLPGGPNATFNPLNPTASPPGVYTYSAVGSNGCINSTSLTMAYNTLGIIAYPAYCSLVPVPLMTLQNNPNYTLPPGGTWTNPTGIPIPSGILNPTVAPTNVPGQYTYSYTDANSCPTTAILSIALATGGSSGGCPATIDVCSLDPPFVLLDQLGCSPAPGGQWLHNYVGPPSPGFVNFYTNAQGIGLTINPANLAQNSTFTYALGTPPCTPTFVNLTVNMNFPVNAGVFTAANVCVTDAPFNLETILNPGANPLTPGLNWALNNGTPIGNIFDPASVANPPQTILMNYSGGLANTGCFAFNVLELTVLPANANAGVSTTVTVCETDPGFQLFDFLDVPANTAQPGGIFTGPAPSTAFFNGFFIPGTTPPGLYTYTVTSTCDTDQATVNVTVNPLPNPGTSGILNICSNAGNVNLITGLGGTPAGGGTWTLGGAPVSNIVNGATVTNGAVYTYTVGPPGCSSSATVTINLTQAPFAGTATAAPQLYCNTDPAFSLFTLLTTPPNVVNGAFWTGPGAYTGANFNPASPLAVTGNYTYTIPNNGCGSDSETIFITVETTPNAGNNATVNACPNATASINLFTLLGGGVTTPGTWTAPPGGPTNGLFAPGSPAGGYTYTVSSPSGQCSDQATVTVTVLTIPSAGSNGTLTVCSNAAPFQLLSVLGTTPTPPTTPPPGAANWFSPSSAVVPGGGNAQFVPGTSLPGVYTYIIPVAGCPVVSATATITVVPPPNAGTNTTTNLCSNLGSIDLTSYLNGSPQTTGSWFQGVTPVTNPFNISALGGTTQVFTYTVNNGTCSSSSTLTVNVQNPPIAGPDQTINLCATGAAFNLNTILNGAAQTPGIWTNPLGVAGNNITLNTAASGVYTYTVAGTACASDAALYTLTVTNAITATVTTTCNAAQTGYVVVITLSGGTGSYTVDGLPIAGNVYTSPVISTPNNFSFIVDDTGPCPAITVNGAAPVCICPATASFAGGNQSICLGNAATLTITTGGTGPWTVVYSANGVNQPPMVINTSGSSISVSPAVNTTYALVSVADANCIGSASGSLTVNVVNPPNAGPDVNPIDLCASGANLPLNTILNAGAQTGGNWTNSAGTPLTSIPIVVASSGVYTYTVVNTPCPADAALYTINITDQISVTGITATCNAAQTGYTVVFSISGGTGAYSVSSSLGLTGTLTGNIFTSGLIPTGNNYGFTVSDTGPCADATVNGAAPNCTCPATASFAGGNQTICNGSSANIVINTPAGTAPWTIVYSANGVNQPPVVINTSGSSITVSPTINTTYALVSVNDANCAGSASGSLTINVVNQPTAGPDVVTNLCATGTNLILNSILNAGAAAGGTWTNSTGTIVTTIPVSVASSGVYTYTVTNAPCPADAAAYTINISDPIVFTGITATCNAAQTNYTVVFTISGGAGGYTVTSPSGLTGTLTGSVFTSAPITAGQNYDFIVSDAGPCANATVNGAAPNCNCPATASFAGGNQTICNGSSANLVITTAGASPWTIVYSANGVNQPAVVINASGGTFTVSPTVNTTYALVSVNDANCTGSATGSLTVNVVNPPNAGPNVTIDNCGTGGNLVLNTILDNTAQGGGTWTNSGGNTVTTLPLTSASSGVYTYTVTNTPCPADVAQYTLNISAPITISGLTAVCNAAQTGYTVSFTINGGAGGITVSSPSLLTGTLVGNVFTSSLITSGTVYDFVVSDAGPCDDVIVGGPSPNCNCNVTGSITGTTNICSGNCATITFNLQGSEPFDVVYQNSNDPFNPVLLTDIFNGHTITVCPSVLTTYTLLNVSDNNCSGVVQGNAVVITVNPPVIISNITETCNALNENYTVVFTVAGGVAPIIVSATGSTPPAGTFNAGTGVYTSAPIPTGNTYSFSVSSAGACPAVIVSGSFSCGCTTDAGTLDLTPIVVCTNEAAQAVATSGPALDANDVFQYILHNGSSNTLGTILATSATGAFNFAGGLVAGQTYFICAIAGNGNGQGGVNQNDPCFSASLGVSVVFNALPTASISGNSTVCPGSAVDFNVNFTGTGPWNYSYSINGNGPTPGTSQSNNSTISGNTPGTYVIQTVTDSNCPGTTTGVANLNNFAAPTAIMTGDPNVCAGSGNGPQIAFTGQGPWTFTYALDGVVQNSITTGFPTYTIPAQTSGLYGMVSVQDVNCSGAASGLLAVNVIASPTAQITGGGAVCQGNTSPFTLLLTGNGPFNVQYTVGGVPQPALNGVMNGHTFESGVAGNYNVVTVTDQACSGPGTAGTAQLQVNALPHGEIITNSNQLCVGQELTFTFNMAGVPPYNITYVIDGDTISLSGVPNNFTQILTPTTSVVAALTYVQDSSNPSCVSNTPASAFVQVGELPNAPVLMNYTICSGAEPLSIGAPPVSGLSYSWSPTTGLSNANIPNPTIQLSVAGVTPRTFVYTLTTTNGECEAIATSEITVDPGPRANFSFSPNPVSSIDPTVRFQNLSDASETTGFYWEFDVFGTSILENPTFKFPEGVDATYTVTLNATDLLTGCSDTHSDLIKVRPEMLVFVPNAFTPDGDGINDLWGPVMANIDENEYRLSVFDRSGRIIFQTLDPDKKWNGSIDGGDFYAQNAVYVWLIETKNKLTSEELEFRGLVTVVR